MNDMNIPIGLYEVQTSDIWAILQQLKGHMDVRRWSKSDGQVGVVCYTKRRADSKWQQKKRL